MAQDCKYTPWEYNHVRDIETQDFVKYSDLLRIVNHCRLSAFFYHNTLIDITNALNSLQRFTISETVRAPDCYFVCISKGEMGDNINALFECLYPAHNFKIKMRCNSSIDINDGPSTIHKVQSIVTILYEMLIKDRVEEAFELQKDNKVENLNVVELYNRSQFEEKYNLFWVGVDPEKTL